MIKKMNIVDKLYQSFVIEKIKQIDFKKGSNSPLIVELDPTAVCNLACPGCISEDIIATGNSFSSERLLKLAKELKEAGIKGVILIGGGEPLSHPAIGELIKYLGENDIHIGITTNGTFIDKYLDEIANFAKWTRVSVDAATKKTFDMLRPPKKGKSQFEKVIDNMKKLAKLKKGKLGFSFLIRSEAEGVETNVNEIYQAAKLAKEIGCDYFEIKPSYNYKNGMAHSLVKHPQYIIQIVKEELQKAQNLVDENFKIIKAITLDEALNGVKIKQEKNYTFCPVAELRTLITPIGVYVCPYWRGNNKFKLGDVKNSSFEEMWNSNQKKEVMKWVNPSIHCKDLHCLRHESNLEILKIKERIEKGEKIEVIDEFDRFI